MSSHLYRAAPPSPQPLAAGRSLLMWGVGERVMAAAAVLAALWLAVAWALN